MFVLTLKFRDNSSNSVNWFLTYDKLFYLATYPSVQINVIKNTFKYSDVI